MIKSCGLGGFVGILGQPAENTENTKTSRNNQKNHRNTLFAMSVTFPRVLCFPWEIISGRKEDTLNSKVVEFDHFSFHP